MLGVGISQVVRTTGECEYFLLNRPGFGCEDLPVFHVHG